MSPDQRPADGEANPGSDTAAIAALIEGEQKLLLVFDARQASADAKITAAATGALALPGATLALANPSKITAYGSVKWGYLVVVVLVICIFGARLWNGGKWRTRSQPPESDPDGSGPPDPGAWHPLARLRAEREKKLKFSTESRDSDAARVAWWGCDPPVELVEVQRLALALWRTRAKHSRQIAQQKEKLAALAGIALALALVIPVLLVFLKH